MKIYMNNNYSYVIPKNNNTCLSLDKFIAVLLALTPILQHYKGIYENAAASILIACFPFLIFRIISKRKLNTSGLLIVLPIIIFDFYKAFDHGVTFGTLAHAILMMIIYAALANDCVDIHTVLKTSFYIGEFASIIIFIQYFCYYILGFHLQVVSTNLLLPESEQWFAGVKTGLISITGSRNGYYRPSSIFLEPSHFFLYVFPQVALLLFAKGKNKWAVKRAVFLSMGVVLSTSGFGIAVIIGIWGIYLLFHSKYYDILRFKQLLSLKSMLAIVFGCVALGTAYINVPFIHASVNRIFVGDQFGNTAISGRTLQANILLSQISGFNILFGVKKDTSDIAFNLSGFAATMYKYGIIGLVLSYIVYIRAILFTKGEFRLIAIIIFIISFFVAHTHGTYHMLYYVAIIVEGFYEIKTKKNID